MIQDLKSYFKSLIDEKFEEAVRRGILPRPSPATNSTPPAVSRSPPYQTETSASKRLYLRIDDTTLPDTLFTMTKIQHQTDSLNVELVDYLGCRVENEPESSAKIRIVVLNGDFEVEDNDCTEEDFSKNLVRPRKDKASSLLKGKCEVLLCRGVANVGDISFTDNSNRNGTFRLGAEVIKNPCGVDIKAAVSKPFTVKERRLLTDRKHEKPSPEDELWRLKNIRRDGPIYLRAKSESICTVKDFLQLLQTYPKRLQKILDVPETKWKEIVENAEACVITNDIYRYYDDATGVELLLDCAFNIVSATFTDQIRQFYGSLNDRQKVVNEARVNAYENRRELKPYTPTNQMQNRVGLPSIYGQHHSDTSIARVSDVTPPEQGESLLRAYSCLPGPSYHFDHENTEQEISLDRLLDDPEQINQMMVELLKTVEVPIDNPTRKLIVACYVTKAATMFMVGIKQDRSPSKKKRKFY